MNLQTIKSLDGKVEYVLLPVAAYHALRVVIHKQLEHPSEEVYEPFNPEDYIDNPVALARINAGLTQEMLAERMHVSQAYISKLERQDKITSKVLKKVIDAIER